MSILIKELEARKDDYILVADVINLLGNATNSAPDEVVKYLMGFDIDEHLTIFYMDEYYSFELYNGHILGLGNDANITYYQKSDVIAFEPITRHGVFKDGSTYHANQYQKNRNDDYLTVSEVIATINSKVDMFCDHEKVRDLARKKQITPCFYFSGYVCGLTTEGKAGPYTETMTGYFTFRLLVEEICKYDDYIYLPSYEVGNEILIHRIIEKQNTGYVNYSDGLTLFESMPQEFANNDNLVFSCIDPNEIRFSKQELDSYIESVTPVTVSYSYEPTTQDSEILAQLESVQAENETLNDRLNKAIGVYKDQQKNIDDLTEQVNQANADNDELNEQLSNVKKELADAKDTATAQPIDWESIGKDENIYPPELHLALMIWQRIYLDNELKNNHLSYHSDKFKVIANRMNLDPESSLGRRVAMLINTARSKNQQATLANPLRAIEQLHMPASDLEPTP